MLPLTRDPTLSQLGVAAWRWDRLWHYLLDSDITCRRITACTAEAYRSSLCGMIRRNRSKTNLQWWIQKVKTYKKKQPERKIRRKKYPLGSNLTLTVRHGVCVDREERWSDLLTGKGWRARLNKFNHLFHQEENLSLSVAKEPLPALLRLKSIVNKPDSATTLRGNKQYLSISFSPTPWEGKTFIHHFHVPCKAAVTAPVTARNAKCA